MGRNWLPVPAPQPAPRACGASGGGGVTATAAVAIAMAVAGLATAGGSAGEVMTVASRGRRGAGALLRPVGCAPPAPVCDLQRSSGARRGETRCTDELDCPGKCSRRNAWKRWQGRCIFAASLSVATDQEICASLLRRDGAAGKNDGVKGRDAWAWVLVQLWHGGRRVTSYLHADGGRVRLVGG